jgi:Protein of unknown function (DUF3592)
MSLQVGDAVTNDPVRDDIARAVDLAPHGADWRLALDNGQDDHIEAVTAADGKFKLTFVDRGNRLDADEAIDGEALKSVLIDYLDGDAHWRDRVHLVGQRGTGSRQRAARRISSKPPAWAIVVVALAFFGSPVVLYLLREAPSGGSRILPLLWIVAGPISVMLIVMIVWKSLQFRRARRWLSAPGRITKSEVSASHLQSEHEATRIVNLPAIEYEFSFNGQKYTGRRIGIGEDSGGGNIEQTLARYPLGASVTVYCDPEDPENCVLERDAPSFMPVQGCATTLASLASIGFIVYWLTSRYDTVLAPLWATGHGRVTLIAAAIGLLSLMAYFGSLIIAKQKSPRWGSVSGVVVDSRAQTSKRRSSKSRDVIYTPIVEYSYRVNGREFRSRQIGPDDQGEDTLADAEKVAGKFPKGGAVVVYFDPGDPGNAMLEAPAIDRPDRKALIAAIVCIAVAIGAQVFPRG